MNKSILWKLSIVATAETEDALTEILQTIFREPACASTDAESGTTCVTVFLQSRPSSALVRRTLPATIQHLKNCGLNTGLAKISVAPLTRENWAESWKRHFLPIEVGQRLLIKPSWNRRRGRKGQIVVVLDPGLSFGTGQHPTTAFCLHQLVANRRRERQSLLDLGTGSGILAIAAAKLGYGPIEAMDFDSEAIRIARRNARANRVARKIHFHLCDVKKLPVRTTSTFSVICANLISPLLVEHQHRIISRLSPDGVAVLAGVLRKEFPIVQQEYEAAGLRLLASRAEREWRSGAFRVADRQPVREKRDARCIFLNGFSQKKSYNWIA